MQHFHNQVIQQYNSGGDGGWRTEETQLLFLWVFTYIVKFTYVLRVLLIFSTSLLTVSVICYDMICLLNFPKRISPRD